MKVYDFSAYVKLRDEKRSAQRVHDLLPHLNEPGATIELKRRLEGWIIVYQQIFKKTA